MIFINVFNCMVYRLPIDFLFPILGFHSFFLSSVIVYLFIFCFCFYSCVGAGPITDMTCDTSN